MSSRGVTGGVDLGNILSRPLCGGRVGIILNAIAKILDHPGHAGQAGIVGCGRFGDRDGKVCKTMREANPIPPGHPEAECGPDTARACLFILAVGVNNVELGSLAVKERDGPLPVALQDGNDNPATASNALPVLLPVHHSAWDVQESCSHTTKTLNRHYGGLFNTVDHTKGRSNFPGSHDGGGMRHAIGEDAQHGGHLLRLHLMKLLAKAAIEGVDFGQMSMPMDVVVAAVNPGGHGLELGIGSEQEAALANVGRAMVPGDVCGEVSVILSAHGRVSWPLEAGEELGELLLWRERFTFEVEVSRPESYVALKPNGLFHFDEVLELSRYLGSELELTGFSLVVIRRGIIWSRGK